MIRCESGQTMSTMLVDDEISFKKSYLRVGNFYRQRSTQGVRDSIK